MSINSNFICYQGFQWQRTFQFFTCSGLFSLDGCGLQFLVKNGDTNLVNLTVGNGIEIDEATSIATVTLTDSQTSAIDADGLPVGGVTEILDQECCGPIVSDTKIGPIASCELILTDALGERLPPMLNGLFLVVTE